MHRYLPPLTERPQFLKCLLMQRQDISVTCILQCSISGVTKLAHSHLGNQWQKQNTLQISEDLHYCPQHAAILPASTFTANPPRTGHSVNPCHLSCLARCPAKSQGLGGSCPGMAGQQSCGVLSRWGLETRSNPNAN